MSLSEYVGTFLSLTGPFISLGAIGAFFLSRYGDLSVSARSRLAVILSLLAAAFLILTPQFAGMHRVENLPLGVAGAFGLGFAIVRLRCTSGRSILGWLCSALHLAFIANAIKELAT